MFLSNIWQQLISKKRLRGISVIVWDFDGTLYDNPQIGQSLKSAYLKYARKMSGKKLTEKDFEHLTDKHGRWSAAAASITHLTEFEIIDEIEKGGYKLKYLRRDDAMVRSIKKLNKFIHVLLTNSSSSHIKDCLSAIGFKPKNGLSHYPFVRIFGREETGCLKPNLMAFALVSDFTRKPVQNHLMIGDSFFEDIEPALKFGFKALHISRISEYIPGFSRSTLTSSPMSPTIP